MRRDLASRLRAMESIHSEQRPARFAVCALTEYLAGGELPPGMDWIKADVDAAKRALAEDTRLEQVERLTRQTDGEDGGEDDGSDGDD